MVEFLGVEIGNVAVNYAIENNGPNLPNVLGAQRAGTYLVLSGDPVINSTIQADSLTDDIDENGGADDLINGTNQRHVIDGNTEVGKCVCIGYMLLKFTETATRMVERRVPPPGKDPAKSKWILTRTMEAVTTHDYVFTTAYNVLRQKAGNPDYKVHLVSANSNDGGQVHTEQICGYRLRALLEHLASLRTGNDRTFNFENWTVTGVVRFSGPGLTKPCPACVGVWTKLQQDYPMLAGVTVAKD